MRINRIKLSGFKSFVDPTTLTLPGNLTGVVGPNGCGKSNIIDALIWVMGESSAKHLRGESMADVIFNGSNTRKPVAQATVEIIFDNTDGTIGGQYAGFGEISIKRSITRDGNSAYFLNGARCRRKDITNVFLGTGIGARGYSVIEQGMISRVIEARPEELRGFLEEAAGISKYKERRRETENRMRHTEENIERLDDIREELDKQLNHLQRQARAAERYQVLKAEERQTSARLLAARWRRLESERAGGQQQVEQRQNDLEAEIAKLREVEASQTAFREAQAEATETFNSIQAEFYARSGDISRLEQAIRHDEEREQGLRSELASVSGDITALAEGLESERRQLDETATAVAGVEPRAERARSTEGDRYRELREAEQRFERWQENWDTFNNAHAELAQRDHAAEIRLEHLLSDLASSESRHSALTAEAANVETGDLGSRIDDLREQLAALETQREQATARRDNARTGIAAQRTSLQGLQASLHERQTALEQRKGRLESLRALQEDAYGGDRERIDAWCREQGLGDVARLAELIDIEPGWERAIEAALRVPLGTLCGRDVTVRLLGADRATLPAATLAALDRDPGVAQRQFSAPELLAARVRGGVDLGGLLAGVYAAENLDAATALRARIGRGDIIVLRDGTVLGNDWVRVRSGEAGEDSILAREREIATLVTEVERDTQGAAGLREQFEQARERLLALESEESASATRADELAREMNQGRNELARVEAEFERRQARAADVVAELERIGQRSSENRASIERLRAEREQTAHDLEAHGQQRAGLVEQRNELQQQVDEARDSWRGERETAHELELQLQELRARSKTLQDAIGRNENQLTQLRTRSGEIERLLGEMTAPRTQMRAELEQALAQKLDAESRLTAARSELGGLDDSMQDAARKRADIEQGINECQQRLEQVRLDQRALEVRQQELVGRFEQTEENLEQTVAGLTDEDTEDSIGEALEKLANRISRLGPINLAAIDEFNQLTERKTYLDQQHADLTDALNTLQEAIRKIDRETRTRFKETYDKVNNGLQTMFPVLFGGGHAYLELTGDDLLETGVTVMARPPGKRNSTIHLLSGGEKALTALSFVFSIFELNPAPFCLLDEVDAPLDDANVVRLTEMLTNMAGTVQFLFITHNKITMEIAEQLIGVTMQEAGVSRLVSVNMDEAVELAATA